jgi:hypothetical protein
MNLPNEKPNPFYYQPGPDFPGRGDLIVSSRNHQDAAPDWWQRLMRWTPTDRQLDSFTDWLMRAAPVADRLLKTAVVLAVLYLLLSFAKVFLPYGPGWIGGAR